MGSDQSDLDVIGFRWSLIQMESDLDVIMVGPWMLCGIG